VLRLHWGKLETMRGQSTASVGAASILLKGTTTRTKTQQEDALNQMQSGLSIGINANGLTVTFNTTRQTWHAFAALMQDMLRHPAFAESEFQLLKTQQIAALQAARDEPRFLASNALNRAANRYEIDDPRYVPTADEAIARWQALTLEDVKRFWTQFAGASVSEFAAVGALDVAQVQQDVADMLEGWDTLGGAAAYTRIERPLQNPVPERIVIATPDKPNAMLWTHQSFNIDPWSREGIAMQLANGLIGGSTASRLSTRLRQEEGLTYGVNSWLSPSEDNQTIGADIQGSFAPQNREKFETLLRAELADIQADGLSSIKLIIAKHIAANQVQAGLNNDGYIRGVLADNDYYSRMGRPRSAAWYEDKQKTLQDITIQEVDAAAKKLADLSHAVMVITGDFTK